MEKPANASTEAPNPHALAGRRVFAQRGSARSGFIDQYEGICTLADAIAEATRTELFVHDEGLVWLREGRLIAVNMEVLRAIIETYIVVQLLENCGSADAPNWEIAYYPYKADAATCRTLLSADNFKTGSLATRVMKA